MHVVATLQNGLHSAGLIIFLTCHNSLRAECENPTLVFTSFFKCRQCFSHIVYPPHPIRFWSREFSCSWPLQFSPIIRLSIELIDTHQICFMNAKFNSKIYSTNTFFQEKIDKEV